MIKKLEVLLNNQDLLKTIAEYLLLVETLTKSDIDEINNTGKLKWVDEKFKEPEEKEATEDVATETPAENAEEVKEEATLEEAKEETNNSEEEKKDETR